MPRRAERIRRVCGGTGCDCVAVSLLRLPGFGVIGYAVAASAQTAFSMNFKTFLKTVVFLAILFVMLYVGMNNPQTIDFHFPIAGTTAKNPIHESAALIYFGIFAIGVLAGTMLSAGGGKGGSKKSAPAKEK